LRKSRGFGSLNIKNPETHKLAGRLAELTGESLAPAVTQSLRERLSRFQAPGERAQALLAISRDCASRLGERARSIDRGEILYDDRGLPE
jgi:antitoxin VapB